eukprot:8966040-Alexandrium_andersonii.AAC.1
MSRTELVGRIVPPIPLEASVWFRLAMLVERWPPTLRCIRINAACPRRPIEPRARCSQWWMRKEAGLL